MDKFLKDIMSKEDMEDIKELVSTVMILSKEDRIVLLSNANAFRVRADLDRAKRETFRTG